MIWLHLTSTAVCVFLLTYLVKIQVFFKLVHYTIFCFGLPRPAMTPSVLQFITSRRGSHVPELHVSKCLIKTAKK